MLGRIEGISLGLLEGKVLKNVDGLIVGCDVGGDVFITVGCLLGESENLIDGKLVDLTVGS